MRTLCISTLALLLLLSPLHLAAADKTAAGLLPASVVVYAEVAAPGKVVDLVLAHPIAAEVTKAPEFQQATQSNDFQRFVGVLKRLEDRLGRKWPEAVSGLTSGGMAVAFDLPTRGAVVLAQAADEGLAEKARAALVETAEEIARGEGRPGAVQKDEHRGTAIHSAGEASLAVVGKWLVASNKKPLVLAVLDAYHGEGETLGADAQFQTVLKSRPSATAWLYADLRVLRLTGALRNALNKKSDNPPVEVLLGGILGALPDAPYVTASLDVSPASLKLAASLPCKPPAVAKTREFYLGADAAGVAPPLLEPAGTLLSLSTYRDFASLWRHAPDLFDEGINAKFAEAESNLKTIFAGRDFRDDILGNVEPGVQIVVTRQEFPQEGVTPAIKLPAAAAVVRMKNPSETARIFKVTFQSVVGFLNVAGAQNGIDPLDLNSEKVGDALVVSSVYLPPADEQARTEAGLHYNASPTVAIVGDRFILASSKPLAMRLVEHVQRGEKGGEQPGKLRTNTLVQLDGKVGLASLAENRGPLVAQNMLQKGHDRAAAEQEIDRVLAALRHFEGASLGLNVGEASLDLAVELRLASGLAGGQ
jgi:hypothetical protein